jgi:hypothetical protein
MYPHERSLVKQLADKPFALIGVNSDSDLNEIREIVKEKNLSWRSFQNRQEFGDISERWGITGWPTIFVLDEKGTIRHRNVRGKAMDRAIEELMAEMGHDVKITHEEDEEKSDEAADSDESGLESTDEKNKSETGDGGKSKADRDK